MKFYDKYFANNYEELITYYPRFYRDVFEMVEILKAHGRIADGLEKNIEQVYFNCFIDYADENTISKFETFLSIERDRNSSLNERRRLIKSYISGFGKISATRIKEMLYPFTETECDVTFLPADEERNNLLNITVPRGATENVPFLKIIDLLSKRLPAHIWFNLGFVYPNEHILHPGFATYEAQTIAFTDYDRGDIFEVTWLIDENGDTLVDEAENILLDS